MEKMMAKSQKNKHYTFVVVGGGIAGVTCTETLALLSPNDFSSCNNILLVAKSEIVKRVSSAVSITRTLTELKIDETQAQNVISEFSNIEFMADCVTKLNYPEKNIETENGMKISFDKLCICTGGKPKLIDDANPFVIGIRDTESVSDFEKRIANSRRILIVGNGGIASEIIHEVRGIDKIWVVKDDHVTKTFLDAGAGEFFCSRFEKSRTHDETPKRISYKASEINNRRGSTGSSSPLSPGNPALGPDWHKNFCLGVSTGSRPGRITLEFNAEVARISGGDGRWPVYAELTNGKLYGADLIVSATGVVPNSEIFRDGNEELELAEDAGILVDWKMETSLKDVFAAGDVASAGWPRAFHWFQMRLWTQARQMGSHAGRCMLASLNDELVLQDFAFEMFSHVTKLYGYKVILLGLFNGQKLDGDYELLLRVTENKEYIKLVIKDGKLQGALLIGETNLEEMCENLILNQLDLSSFGEDLLDPDIDIDDYFD